MKLLSCNIIYYVTILSECLYKLCTTTNQTIILSCPPLQFLNIKQISYYIQIDSFVFGLHYFLFEILMRLFKVLQTFQNILLAVLGFCQYSARFCLALKHFSLAVQSGGLCQDSSESLKILLSSSFDIIVNIGVIAGLRHLCRDL